MEIRQAAKSVADREDEGTVVHIRDETGEKQFYEVDGVVKPVVIKVAGSYSSKYRRALDTNRDRMLKRRGANIDGDQLNEQGLAIIAACVLAWDGFTADGKPFNLTKDNAVALFDQCPWIREQVETAMSDHANFLKAS